MGQMYFGDQAGKWVRIRSALTGIQMLPVPLKIPAADVRQFWHHARTRIRHQWLRGVLARLGFEQLGY